MMVIGSIVTLKTVRNKQNAYEALQNHAFNFLHLTHFVRIYISMQQSL